jgi:hypothetical protein
LDSVSLTAFVGLFGASVGSITSLSTTWLAQRSHVQEVRRNAAKHVREELFRDFISEASRLYGDALSHEKDDVSSLVALYALVGRIRLVATVEVIRAAEESMERIIEAYLAPNRTLHELRELTRAGHVDFLQEFARACRVELVEVLSGRRLNARDLDVLRPRSADD